MTPFDELAALLRENEIGRRITIDTPYGPRLLCYADMTATGRYLAFVETWLARMAAYYANTHTTISSTGRIMTELREQSRRAIARAVGADAGDAVLFVGAGATAAVNTLVGLLGLREAPPDSGLPPVVFVGPYEHHSNELPWLESRAEVVEIALGGDGGIDLHDLEQKLAAAAARPLKIGAFSAASNVTGILTDVRAVARILHRAGALAVFDYAAAAPYVPIDMHPRDEHERIDAMVLSTHKFVGGPQGSGVLVMRRTLARTHVPQRPGGGTVDFVSAVAHGSVDYSPRFEEREESGTPAIMGDIRAGVAFLIKEMMGPAEVLAHETALAARAIARLAKHPRIRLLGPLDLPRLAIVSLNIEGLHHDLVSTLLDQLFGIQNRAGCACAGPYGHRLLGVDHERSELYRRQIARGNLGVKPGWVRLTLPYYASEADLEFILSAVEFVAEHGEAFVPGYELDWRDGSWRHVDRPAHPSMPFMLTAEAVAAAARKAAGAEAATPLSEAALAAERKRYFAEASAEANALRARWAKHPPRFNLPTGIRDVDELVWFKYVHTTGAPG
jgi:selenocysteine lyase/cysteine desulfurase